MAGRGSIRRSRGRSHCKAPSYTWPPCQRTRSAHAGKTLGFCRRTGATATGVVERCAASVIVRVTAPKGWAAEARPRSEAKPCSGWRPRPGTVRPCPEASKRLEARSRPGARARLEGRARSVTRPCLEARARPDSTPRGAEQQLEADLLLRGYLCHFAACNTGGLKTGSYFGRSSKNGYRYSNNSRLYTRILHVFNVQYMIWGAAEHAVIGVQKQSRRSRRGRTH